MDSFLLAISTSIFNLTHMDDLFFSGSIQEETYINGVAQETTNLANLLNLFADDTGVSISEIRMELASFANLLIDSFTQKINSLQTTLSQLISGTFFNITNQADTNHTLITQHINDAVSVLSSQNNSLLSAINNIVVGGIDNIDALLFDLGSSIRAHIDVRTNEVNTHVAQVGQLIGAKVDAQTSILTDEIRAITGTGNSDSGGELSRDEIINYVNEFLDYLANINDNLFNTSTALDWFKTNPLKVEGDLVDINVGEGEGGSDFSSSIGVGIGFELAKLFTNGFDDTNNQISQFNIIFNKLANGEYNNFNDLYSELSGIGITGVITGLFFNITQTLALLVGSSFAGISPHLNNISTTSRTTALDALVNEGVLTEMDMRDLWDKLDIRSRFRKLGYDATDQEILKESATIQLQDYYVRDAFLRGNYTLREHDESMYKLGYRPEDLDLIRELYNRIPPYQDIIRFAVREAFNPEQVKKLQLDADYEIIQEQLEKTFKALGYDPQFAKYSWYAHWQLPSPTQGYEMLHRGIIDETELANLLKVSDYSPEWQEKLMKISYSNLTRVDIRRMYGSGHLSIPEVLQAHKNIGYDDFWAGKLTDWVVDTIDQPEDDSTKNITLAKIMQAYGLGLKDRDWAKTNIIKMGYSESNTELLLELAEISVKADMQADVTKDNYRRIINEASKGYIGGILPEHSVRMYLDEVGYSVDQIDKELEALKLERRLAINQEKIDYIRTRYIQFRDDLNTTKDMLSRLGFNGIETNDIIELWSSVRLELDKLPSRTDLSKFIEGNIIGEVKWRQFMKALGYDDEIIEYYWKELSN